ncbi:MAG: hypothetical protein JXR51_13640 [Bacteroidales bacterium]|nr:hypothetical protein [Bacteroidales bacterium]MBN2758210.1 hypothetical protein [Bacteroidales bacterium]
MKKKSIIMLILVVTFLFSLSCNKDESSPSVNFNDVKITVSFGQSLKNAETIPMTLETPSNYYIALKSAVLIGENETADYQLFNNSNLSNSLVFDFTDENIKRSLLQGDDIPEGDYSGLKIEIYYLQMNINISTTNRGVERRNIRIYLSDDAETEGGLHQPGDMTQISDGGIEYGWLLGEGQFPDMDPVSPRVSAYTHDGDGVSWYDFAGKSANNYGPFGNTDFMNNDPHPIYYSNVTFNFDENSSGKTLVVEFDVEDCWQFEDKSLDGYFGSADLDALNPTNWSMQLPLISVYLE